MMGTYLFLVLPPITGTYTRKENKMMKTKLKLLCWALALILLLTACSGGTGTAAPADTASPAPSAPPAEPEEPGDDGDSDGQEPEEIEEWRAEQKIVVNGETYQFLFRALFMEEGDPLTARLESDVLLTDSAVVLGTSDYGGMFNGQEMTVPSQNIVIDLNGHTLTAAEGCAVFEVQVGYTLTVVDGSADKTGTLVADGEPVIVEDGGTYNPLSD